MHFSNGFSFGCVIYHRFLYRLQKIVILKSNYCQGKFHLFFAIEHAQKLKSLVKVVENPCREWNFRAECPAKNVYTSITTEVELCKQMSSDDWRWNCSWNHCESRGDPGASRMMFLVYDIGHVWILKIMKDENSYTHQTLGFV